jgi:hypothetical protein
MSRIAEICEFISNLHLKKLLKVALTLQLNRVQAKIWLYYRMKNIIE